MVSFGARPGRSGLVATLTSRLPIVNGSGGPGGQAKTRTQVAGRALVGDRLLRVVPLGGFPGGSAVAAHAVHGGGHVLGVLARSR